MNKLQSIGILVCGLGIAMFVFGVYMFTYQGNSLNPFVSELGKYSFEFWLPALVIGVLLLIIASIKKK
jgi:hypothetical protein